MKIGALIAHLQEIETLCGPDQVVMAFDEVCGEEYFPITGFIYGGGEGRVELCTAED